jgi:hypothetical protein
VNIYGQPHRKTTIWLGSDDGDPEGMSGYGYDVRRKDSVLSIEYTRELGENDEALEVLILPDLFPKIRQAMDAIEARQRQRGEQGEEGAGGEH